MVVVLQLRMDGEVVPPVRHTDDWMVAFHRTTAAAE
jgi:hypothetical protein